MPKIQEESEDDGEEEPWVRLLSKPPILHQLAAMIGWRGFCTSVHSLQLQVSFPPGPEVCDKIFEKLVLYFIFQFLVLFLVWTPTLAVCFTFKLLFICV